MIIFFSFEQVLCRCRFCEKMTEIEVSYGMGNDIFSEMLRV
jgi:hypothetical protein